MSLSTFIAGIALRRIAAGLLAAVVGLGVWLWWQHARLDLARAQVRDLSEQVESLTTSLRSAAIANAEWEALHRQAVTHIEQCHADIVVLGAQNAEALATSRQQAIIAQANLRAWQSRYARLTSDAECGPLLATPICATLQEDVP